MHRISEPFLHNFTHNHRHTPPIRTHSPIHGATHNHQFSPALLLTHTSLCHPHSPSQDPDFGRFFRAPVDPSKPKPPIVIPGYAFGTWMPGQAHTLDGPPPAPALLSPPTITPPPGLSLSPPTPLPPRLSPTNPPLPGLSLPHPSRYALVPANLERKIQMGKAPLGHDPALLHATAAAAEMPGTCYAHILCNVLTRCDLSHARSPV